MSVHSRTSPRPALPDPAFRRQLETIYAGLAELGKACPPGHGMGAALEVIEQELLTLGWEYPPLPADDMAYLAALGCPS